MTTDYKVTELFCIIDEFFANILKQKTQEICWKTAVTSSVEGVLSHCQTVKS